MTGNVLRQTSIPKSAMHSLESASDLLRSRIDMFCEDDGTADRAAQALSERRFAMAETCIRMGGMKTAKVVYADAPSPDLIIVESLREPAGMLADLERLAEFCDEGVKVIVIGHVNDVVLYRELLHRHVSDYLVAPVDPAELARSIAAAMKDPSVETQGRVIAFIGAKGGCGSSTMCHNVGWVLSETLKAETVIADFDLAFGTLGLDFNQDGVQGLYDALSASDKLDAAMMSKLLSRCSDQLGLLTGSYMLDTELTIEPESATCFVQIARQTTPFTLPDLPREWRDWSRGLIERADDVVITAEPDLANLRNTKNLLDTICPLREECRAPLLILNKVGMPRRPEISVRDFANALDIEPAASIGFDTQLFGTAANNGLMIGELAPKASQLSLFRLIAEKLGGKARAPKAAGGLIKPLIDRFSRKLAG